MCGAAVAAAAAAHGGVGKSLLPFPSDDGGSAAHSGKVVEEVEGGGTRKVALGHGNIGHSRPNLTPLLESSNENFR